MSFSEWIIARTDAKPYNNLPIATEKKVSMIRNNHNHTLQTNPWHREENAEQ